MAGGCNPPLQNVKKKIEKINTSIAKQNIKQKQKNQPPPGTKMQQEKKKMDIVYMFVCRSSSIPHHVLSLIYWSAPVFVIFGWSCDLHIHLRI